MARQLFTQILQLNPEDHMGARVVGALLTHSESSMR